MYINNAKIVMHPVFGEIRIGEKFEKVLSLPVFVRLSHKSQLGTKALSGIINAKHTRLMHSIGVMYLVDFALKCIKENVKEFFPLNEREIEVLKLAALGHDLGHLAFSHSMENIETKSHEERTIECFLINANEINQIFGYDITSSVLRFYENKVQENTIDEVDIQKILSFRNLLIGDLDCDRMEYMSTDNFLVNGKKTDFVKILKHLSISSKNEKITLVYDQKVLPIIVNMLYHRYALYDNMYYSAGLKLSEMIVRKYIELEKIPENQIELMQEYDLLCELDSYLDSDCLPRYKRVAEALLQGKIEDCLIIRIKDNEQFRFFLRRLEDILGNSKEIFMNIDRKKLCICSKENEIYIRDENGVIKNIKHFKEAMFITNQPVINYNYVMIDLKNSPDLNEKQKIKIRELFNEAHVKIKKRFKCVSNNRTLNDFSHILEMYNSKNKQYNKEEIEYYYKIENSIDKVILKYVKSKNGEDCAIIQIFQNDGFDFLKYYESKSYNCKTKKEILEYANTILKYKGLELIEENKLLDEDVIVYKITSSVILEDKENNYVIKLSCINSNSINEKMRIKNVVLEAELIKGNEIALAYLQKDLEKFGYYEVKKSLYEWLGI